MTDPLLAELKDPRLMATLMIGTARGQGAPPSVLVDAGAEERWPGEDSPLVASAADGGRSSSGKSQDGHQVQSLKSPTGLSTHFQPVPARRSVGSLPEASVGAELAGGPGGSWRGGDESERGAESPEEGGAGLLVGATADEDSAAAAAGRRGSLSGADGARPDERCILAPLPPPPLLARRPQRHHTPAHHHPPTSPSRTVPRFDFFYDQSEGNIRHEQILSWSHPLHQTVRAGDKWIEK